MIVESPADADAIMSSSSLHATQETAESWPGKTKSGAARIGVVADVMAAPAAGETAPRNEGNAAGNDTAASCQTHKVVSRDPVTQNEPAAPNEDATQVTTSVCTRSDCKSRTSSPPASLRTRSRASQCGADTSKRASARAVKHADDTATDAANGGSEGPRQVALSEPAEGGVPSYSSV